MLRLSEEIGQDVWSRDGARLGRVSDLCVHDDPDEPAVVQLIVRDRDHVHRVPWADVVSFEHSRVELGLASFGAAAEDRAPSPDDEHELRLDRDVLDAQIVDIQGHRLLRCADVLLTRRDDAALIVVGVDVGFGAVVRRLGLARFSRRFPAEIVPWASLHLASRHGHDVQLVTRSSELQRLSGEDLAHLLTRLSVSHAGEVLQQASVDRAAEALAVAHDEVGRRLLASLPEQDAEGLLEALPTKRAETLRRLLARTPRPRRRYHRTRGWRKHQPRPASSDEGGARRT